MKINPLGNGRHAAVFALSALVAAAIWVPISNAGIDINVYPALAPNTFGSPNFTGWANNAVSALYNGQALSGTPGTPAFYAQYPDRSRFMIILSRTSTLGGVTPIQRRRLVRLSEANSVRD